MSNPYASPDPQGNTESSEALKQNVRGMQIITFAMVMGATIALGIMLAVNGGKVDGEPDFLAWFGLGMAAFMFAQHLIIPPTIVNNQLKGLTAESLKTSSDDEKLMAVLGPIRGGHIIACALLEGAAFMNVVFYMATDYIGNVIAAAILTLLIVLKIPTVFGMQNKVTDRLREIEMR
ncbi:hypothetical protein [Fuerstiella marisgermanici]|uniref:Uncharacterized protein n=1 Tax=Fuerstiella marisgermanici TaxID=1891926 RepID=A0A1P8WIJ0_9PLAN|nr:hypothetical protein [Fuerstiella marisgermanici]APZ93868.1 hypothetical protein Fuma_03486 [Fuerstiella marisgermanici]